MLVAWIYYLCCMWRTLGVSYSLLSSKTKMWAKIIHTIKVCPCTVHPALYRRKTSFKISIKTTAIHGHWTQSVSTKSTSCEIIIVYSFIRVFMNLAPNNKSTTEPKEQLVPFKREDKSKHTIEEDNSETRVISQMKGFQHKMLSCILIINVQRHDEWIGMFKI